MAKWTEVVVVVDTRAPSRSRIQLSTPGVATPPSRVSRPRRRSGSTWSRTEFWVPSFFTGVAGLADGKPRRGGGDGRGAEFQISESIRCDASEKRTTRERAKKKEESVGRYRPRRVRRRNRRRVGGQSARSSLVDDTHSRRKRNEKGPRGRVVRRHQHRSTPSGAAAKLSKAAKSEKGKERQRNREGDLGKTSLTI